MSCPDMRTPIAYSLAWPNRMQAPTARLDLASHRRAHLRGAGRDALPGARALRATCSPPAAAPAPCSTPPTRSRLRRFSTAASASLRSRRLVEATLDRSAHISAALARQRRRRPCHRRGSAGPSRARFSARLHNRPRRARKPSASRIRLWTRYSSFQASATRALLSASLPVRAHHRGVLPRARPFSCGPLVRRRGQDLLDRLRARDLRLQRPARHALAAVLDPARRLCEIHRRRERSQRRSAAPRSA